VFDYAMREGPRLAEAFTSGLAAGQRARESKQRAKEVETARGDRLTERNQALMEKFGADAVVDPESGVVDVTRSAGAARDRAGLAAMAMQAGEAEAMGMSLADFPDEARQLPEYKAGLAKGLARVQQEERMLERIGTREDAMMKRQLEVEKLQQEGLNRRQQEKDSADFLQTILRPPSGSSATRPSIRVTEGPTGTSINRTFGSEDELRAFQQQEAARKGASGGTGDTEYDDAVRAVLKQYEDLQGRGLGEGWDIETDSKGIPRLESSWMFDTATPEAIAALRRKVNPKGGSRSGVPLRDVMPGQR
jgi:hypothetical protein